MNTISKLHENEQRDIQLARKEEALLAERRGLFQNPQQDRAVRATKMARGENVDSRPISERLREIDSEVLDIRAARVLLADERKQLRAEEEKQTRDSYKEAVAAEYRKMGPALLTFVEGLRKVETIQNSLLARGFGFAGVPCSIDTQHVFPDPTRDRGSSLASLLRNFKAQGFIPKLPEGV